METQLAFPPGHRGLQDCRQHLTPEGAFLRFFQDVTTAGTGGRAGHKSSLSRNKLHSPGWGGHWGGMGGDDGGCPMKQAEQLFRESGMGMSKWSRQPISSGIPAVFQRVRLTCCGLLKCSHMSIQAGNLQHRVGSRQECPMRVKC